MGWGSGAELNVGRTPRKSDEVTTSTKEERRFGFGSNWSDYVGKHFSSERVETAKAHLLGFLKLYALEGPFEHVGGFGWSARAPSEGVFGSPAAFMLYENGSPVGWPEAPLKRICKWGRGRYRDEDERLIFSTTDGADPNSDVMRFEYRTDFDSISSD